MSVHRPFLSGHAFYICYLTDKRAEEDIIHTRKAETLKASLAVGPPVVSKTMTNGSPCIPDICNGPSLPTIEIHMHSQRGVEN